MKIRKRDCVGHDIKELGLYLHIPFCIKKCDYCDFLSAPASEEVRRAYVGQLLKEIAACADFYKDYRVITIFIGGGTPSILTEKQTGALIEAIHRNFHVCPDAEITIECNPGTLDPGKLKTYQELGISRLSMGLQSADPGELKMLGRIHTYEQFVLNYRQAREIGFRNINVDLMSALPGQKISTYEKTLQKVLELRPEHISAYSLIIEEGTPFFDRFYQAEILREKGRAQDLLPTEEEERQMYVLTKNLLKSAGYHRYEISNYALAGYECRHNIGYWTRRGYLGLGLGAASMVDDIRFTDTSDLQVYLRSDLSQAGCCLHETAERLDRQAQMEEFMFLGLRMMRGVSAQEFKRQFFLPVEEVYGTVLERQLKEGLLKKTEAGYCLTDFGIDVSNHVMAQYLLGADPDMV